MEKHAIEEVGKRGASLDKPEDVLQSPDELLIDKRARLFEREGRFEQMLALKATLEYFRTGLKGFLSGGAHTVGENLYNSPKRLRDHAYAVLGVPSDQTGSIADSELVALRTKCMEENRVEFLEEINMYKVEMLKFESTQRSGAFKVALGLLEEMKDLIAQNRWEDFTYAQIKLQGIITGTQQLLELMLGGQAEDDYVRQRFNLPTREEAYRGLR